MTYHMNWYLQVALLSAILGSWQSIFLYILTFIIENLSDAYIIICIRSGMNESQIH